MNASRDACSSPTNVTDLLSDLSVTTAREEGSVFGEEDPDTAPLSVCSSPTNVPDLVRDTTDESVFDEEDDTNFVTHPSLKQLFDGIDQPIADAGHICQLIRPFVINAIAQDESPILHEILAFLDHGLVEPCASGWSCSNGQVHAIVHLLNKNQFLLEDNTRVSQSKMTTEDESFLKELERM